jgi:hypothetical protein
MQNAQCGTSVDGSIGLRLPERAASPRGLLSCRVPAKNYDSELTTDN